MPQGAVIWDYSRPVTHTHVAVLPMAMGGAGDVSIAISIAWHTSQLPSHHREHTGFYYFTWTLVENFGSPPQRHLKSKTNLGYQRAGKKPTSQCNPGTDGRVFSHFKIPRGTLRIEHLVVDSPLKTQLWGMRQE